MIDIRVEGLVKSFDLEKKILDGLTFQVDTGERVGLLGRNGAGKTTLFKILTGELDYDSGTVQIASGRRVGLISQIPVYPEGYTVEDVLRTAFARMFRMKDEMDALTLAMEQGASDDATLRRYGELNARFEGLGGWDTDTAVNKVANGLSISDEMRTRLFDRLSGGEKTRVNLGRLILEDTDVLLLDEPTNHLDLQATEWLEDYLRNFRGTVVTISHDRYFLDRTVTRIIEIQDGKAEFYSGNYSFYAIEKERRYQERMKQYLKEQAKIQQLEKAAEQMHLWAFMGNDALHKRAFSMEKRIERMRTTQKPTKARRLEARFQSREFKGDEVLQIKGISKSFGERRLFEDVYLRVEGGERIALLGENGTGKTTLLNMIVGLDGPDTGMIRLGPSVKAAYLPQVIHFDHPERSILDTMLYELDITPQSARNRLAAYQFTGEDVFKSVSVLSGGELSRLRLCMLMDESINLLILDEPTNHLDIDSREWLEQAVEDFDGTLLFVSHDRYFLDRVCSDILEVDQRSVCLYKGNYAYYVEKKQERAEAAEARRESDLNLYRRELEWMRRQPQARATKARARIDSFHELDARLKSTRTQASLKLDVQATRIGTKIFEAKELCKRFGDLVILDRFNYNFARYDKLGIVGDNGCGKSTFLKLLTGIIQPDSGTIEVGESVRFGYYSQQGLDFDEGKRVIDIVTDIAHEIHLGDGRRMSASQFLQYFLFPPEVQYSYVARLSGGERKRLYLCTILIQSPNFLILDEPTNDLDIVTLGVLEEYLQAFKGCVIVVSHDRYFVDKVADHLLVFCGGGEIREFAGTYSDYTAWKRDYEAAKQAAVAQEKAKSTASGSRGGEIRKSGTAPAKTGAARKLTFQEKREMEHLEAEIPELEQEKAAIEEKLSSGDLPFEELTALSERITALMDQIDTKSMRWLELSEIGG